MARHRIKSRKLCAYEWVDVKSTEHRAEAETSSKCKAFRTDGMDRQSDGIEDWWEGGGRKTESRKSLNEMNKNRKF